jgi:hypothetical protein
MANAGNGNLVGVLVLGADGDAVVCDARRALPLAIGYGRHVDHASAPMGGRARRTGVVARRERELARLRLGRPRTARRRLNSRLGGVRTRRGLVEAPSRGVKSREVELEFAAHLGDVGGASGRDEFDLVVVVDRDVLLHGVAAESP